MGQRVLNWYRKGWEVFMSQPITLVAAFLIVAFFTGGIDLVNRALRIDGMMINLVKIAVAPPIFVGWTLLSLRAVRGERVRAVSVFDGFSVWLHAVLGEVMFGAALFVGLMLMVVPGLFVLVTFGLWPFGVGVRGLTAVDAFKHSYHTTAGHRWSLLLAGGIALLLVVASALAFGIPMLVVGPLLGTTLAVIYADLSGDQPADDSAADYEIVQ
jgi:uncharacterized membrane protein